MNNYPITHHIIMANGGRPRHKDWTQIFHSRLKRECFVVVVVVVVAFCFSVRATSSVEVHLD